MTKLLVVDDNEQNRYLAEVLFTGNGYVVDLAGNGSEALEMAREAPPDMVIADILMPVMDGFALCREWRQDDRLKSIPFIFYTATYTDPEDEEFALGLGADRFICKPVPPDTLLRLTREVWEKSQAGIPLATAHRHSEEDVYLKKYNQKLIHKLESKLVQLDNANKKLEREIEERKRTEKGMYKLKSQLIQSQKMEAIGTLAGGIAHDFNNILLAILGNAQIALIDAQNGKPVDGHLQEVVKACYRAKELVGQILTFSRQSTIQREPVQVDVVVRDVLKMLRASLPSTIGISVKLKSHSRVMANPTQIYQVIVNLGTNAGQAIGEKGGTIVVALSDVELDEDFCSMHHNLIPGLYQKLEVSDDGMGISPDKLLRIFDPYFSTKQNEEGTGLGLALVHGIVQDTGGVIIAESEHGKGSNFKVFLPVAEFEEDTQYRDTELPEQGWERILLVDDEVALTEVCVKMLEQLGYEVTPFNNSQEALVVFQDQPDAFDLVITDMTMPGLTGDVLTRRLLQVRADLPVLLCTGFSNKINEQNALQLGARAFLMKPFDIVALSRAVRQALAKEL